MLTWPKVYRLVGLVSSAKTPPLKAVGLEDVGFGCVALSQRVQRNVFVGGQLVQLLARLCQQEGCNR